MSRWLNQTEGFVFFFRYTLTEGDFHHLKKARLTHLALPPAPCDLKILTIMECDSTESSTLNINDTAAPKLPLTIYQVDFRWLKFDLNTSPRFPHVFGDFSLQPTERRVPDWVGLSLSRGLPGDQHHSAILDQSHGQASSAVNAQQPWSQTVSFTHCVLQVNACFVTAPLEGSVGLLIGRWSSNACKYSTSRDNKLTVFIYSPLSLVFSEQHSGARLRGTPVREDFVCRSHFFCICSVPA